MQPSDEAALIERARREPDALAALDEVEIWIKDTGLNNRGNVIAIPFPFPEVEGHGQGGWTAIIPTLILIYINKTSERYRFW